MSTADTVTNLTKRRCFLLPSSFSYVNRHRAKLQVSRTTAFVHKVKTTTASVCGPNAATKLCTARGRNSRTCKLTRSHTHTLTHTPFTGATMHRNTKVTTSSNTSHYEYCFQREAIHGIKTSTRVTPLARMKNCRQRRGVTTAREGSTDCP